MDIPEILEAFMMVCFGVSWPAQIIKTLRVKDPKGKSFLFLFLIMAGYLAGIISKLFEDNFSHVIWLYLLNLVMVAFDTGMSLHYKHRLSQKAKDAMTAEQG